MDLTEFSTYGERLVGGAEPKDRVIIECLDKLDPRSSDFMGAISFLTREPFDDIGVGKTSLREIAAETLDTDVSTLRDHERDYGDLPSAIGHVAAETNRLVPRTDVSLGDLYRRCHQIRDATGDEGGRLIRQALSDYKEPKWVAHAFLGKKGVSFGVGEKSVVSILCKEHGIDDSRRALALNPRVVDLCATIASPESYHNPIMQPLCGRPFLPMLAKSKPIPEDPRAEWMIQPKYDGARILVHYNTADDGILRAFSRNANDVTNSLPELRELEDVITAEGQYIFDGEAIPYKDGERQPFQQVMTRFGRQEDVDEQEIDIEFKFFDLVYAENEWPAYDGDVSKMTAGGRYFLLFWLFAHDHTDWVAPSYTPMLDEDLVSHYQEFLRDGLEGAVVKRVDAPYEFNRRSPHWRKMLPTKENVELRVVAVHEGENSNAGMVGGMELETEDGTPVGRVGAGIEDYDGIKWEERDTVVDEIVEVSWRELQANDDGTYALRFPSLEAFREDKDEADTLDKLKTL